MTPWIISFLAMTCAVETPVEVIAHRGESADAPENTMAAFRLAWERQVDGFELDVHLTEDGQLAVLHDADTKRTAGQKKVVKQTPWAELRDLDVGRWKDERFTGERIPLLADVLRQIPAGIRCFVEVKVGPEAIPALVEAVRTSGKPPEQLVVISFHAETVAEAKRRLPELKAYYLSSFKRNAETGEVRPTVDALIAEAKRIRADGLNVSFEGPIDAEFVRRVKDAGLKFYVWTVDDEQVAKRLAGLGVDGITTNKAAWLRNALSR
ncbi:MAG: glycerophosphodiester phosphodiesterase [Pirellulaceae bacterium]